MFATHFDLTGSAFLILQKCQSLVINVCISLRFHLSATGISNGLTYAGNFATFQICSLRKGSLRPNKIAHTDTR